MVARQLNADALLCAQENLRLASRKRLAEYNTRCAERDQVHPSSSVGIGKENTDVLPPDLLLVST
jgi:hypothetical protein